MVSDHLPGMRAVVVVEGSERSESIAEVRAGEEGDAAMPEEGVACWPCHESLAEMRVEEMGEEKSERRERERERSASASS